MISQELGSYIIYDRELNFTTAVKDLKTAKAINHRLQETKEFLNVWLKYDKLQKICAGHSKPIAWEAVSLLNSGLLAGLTIKYNGESRLEAKNKLNAITTAEFLEKRVAKTLMRLHRMNLASKKVIESKAFNKMHLSVQQATMLAATNVLHDCNKMLIYIQKYYPVSFAKIVKLYENEENF